MTNTASYRRTQIACYIASVVQAIPNSFLPLLYARFTVEFGLPLSQIAFLTTLNWTVQLALALWIARMAERTGYRAFVRIAHACSIIGLIGLAVFPSVLPSPYIGILLAILFTGFANGVTEVVLNPIMESCPTDDRAGALSFMHSCYSWGFVVIILLSTAFFAIFGIARWRILAVIWAAVPLFNFFYIRRAPVAPPQKDPAGGDRGESPAAFFRKRGFVLFLLLILCGGAAEVGLYSWSSTFAELGLHVSKTVGDLAGPCAFSALMGLSRMLYSRFSHRLDLWRAMLVCAGMCFACYALVVFSGNAALSLLGCALCGFSVGIFWPGAIALCSRGMQSMASSMYALLAIFGESGAAIAPALIGQVAERAGGNLRAGLGVGMLFPVFIMILLYAIRKLHSKNGGFRKIL